MFLIFARRIPKRTRPKQWHPQAWLRWWRWNSRRRRAFPAMRGGRQASGSHLLPVWCKVWGWKGRCSRGFGSGATVLWWGRGSGLGRWGTPWHWELVQSAGGGSGWPEWELGCHGNSYHQERFGREQKSSAAAFADAPKKRKVVEALDGWG